MVQDFTKANISAIAAENLPAFTIPLSKVTVPNKPTDNNNIDNYNSIDWKQLPDL